MKTTQKAARGGIRIRQYCAEHEALVRARLADGGPEPGLLLLHERKLLRMQHERLVHLLVTALTAALLLFSIWLFLFLAEGLVLILVAAAFCLTGAYIRHYFFLENTVQRWYLLHDELEAALKK